MAAALAVGLLLTGCSGGGDAKPSNPDAPSFSALPAGDLWNPCDSLTATGVGRLLHGTVRKDTGTADAPQCAFDPTASGEPAVTANYSLVPGTIEELIASFGSPRPGIRVLTPSVPQSDGARLLVSVQGGTLTVSGFVKNGDLVQSINVLDPSPFRRRSTVAGSAGILRALAGHADESGLTESETPAPSSPATS